MNARRRFLVAAVGGAAGGLARAAASPAKAASARKADSSLALALGGGAARGLAHIPVLEALDELGVRPRVIAGTSIGAIIGAGYAAGLSGRALRDHVVELFESRFETIRRLFPANPLRWASVFAAEDAAILNPEMLMRNVLPDAVPETFDALSIPLRIVAADFRDQSEVILRDGPLFAAIGASASLPLLLAPVVIDGRILIDGGFVNPTPFDIVDGDAGITLAVDVTGNGNADIAGRPGPIDTWVGATQIALHSLVNERLKRITPDLLIRPDVGHFSSLSFKDARAIMAAAEPTKDMVKRGIERLVRARG